MKDIELDVVYDKKKDLSGHGKVRVKDSNGIYHTYNTEWIKNASDAPCFCMFERKPDGKIFYMGRDRQRKE